jgi:putative Mg2+ transporter-C (MgtC) family protein
MFIDIFTGWTPLNILVRIFISVLLGGIIGLDRGIKRRGAGIKTNTVVCLGSTLVMLTAQFMQVEYPDQADMSRMAAQVISGVGFLGVGTIIVANHQVKGLTTAASLWTCACIGLAVGIGFISGGIIITLTVLLSLHVLPYVEHFVYDKSRYYNILFGIDGNHALHTLIETFKSSRMRIDSIEVVKPKVKGQNLSVIVSVKTKNRIKSDEFMELFKNHDDILSIEFL